MKDFPSNASGSILGMHSKVEALDAYIRLFLFFFTAGASMAGLRPFYFKQGSFSIGCFRPESIRWRASSFLL